MIQELRAEGTALSVKSLVIKLRHSLTSFRSVGSNQVATLTVTDIRCLQFIFDLFQCVIGSVGMTHSGSIEGRGFMYQPVTTAAKIRTHVEELNECLQKLQPGDIVVVDYYCQYECVYKQMSGQVKKIDLYWESIQIGEIAVCFSEISNIIVI